LPCPSYPRRSGNFMEFWIVAFNQIHWSFNFVRDNLSQYRSRAYRTANTLCKRSRKNKTGKFSSHSEYCSSDSSFSTVLISGILFYLCEHIIILFIGVARGCSGCICTPKQTKIRRNLQAKFVNAPPAHQVYTRGRERVNFRTFLLSGRDMEVDLELQTVFWGRRLKRSLTFWGKKYPPYKIPATPMVLFGRSRADAIHLAITHHLSESPVR